MEISIKICDSDSLKVKQAKAKISDMISKHPDSIKITAFISNLDFEKREGDSLRSFTDEKMCFLFYKLNDDPEEIQLRLDHVLTDGFPHKSR